MLLLLFAARPRNWDPAVTTIGADFCGGGGEDVEVGGGKVGCTLVGVSSGLLPGESG